MGSQAKKRRKYFGRNHLRQANRSQSRHVRLGKLGVEGDILIDYCVLTTLAAIALKSKDGNTWS